MINIKRSNFFLNKKNNLKNFYQNIKNKKIKYFFGFKNISKILYPYVTIIFAYPNYYNPRGAI